MHEFLYFLSGLAFYFCMDILKTYLKKKIENEATIEDLPLITKVSENVKQDFRKEISNLDAQLSILTNQKSLVDEKAIHVLNQFFERCLELKDLHSRNFGDFMGKDLAQVLVDYQLKVEETHRKLYSDYHILLLYHSNNKSLIKSAEEIVSSSSIVLDTFKTHFSKIKLAILTEADSISTDTYKEKVANSNEVISQYYSDQKGNIDFFNKSFTELMRSLNKSITELGRES